MDRPALPAGDAAPAVVAPPPGHPRFPLVDSLRAIAVLSVFAYHVGLASGANAAAWWGGLTSELNAGVTLFFLISGFLLYRPFVAARLGHGPGVGAGDFWRRRALRILPAYWLALTTLALWPGLPGVFTGDWWQYYGLVHNYSPANVFGGLGVSWSLSVEASFYAVLPLYAVVATRAGRRMPPRRAMATELAALGAIAAAALVFDRVTIDHTSDPLRAYARLLTLPGTADWFALGMGLAVVGATFDIRPGRIGTSRGRARASLASWAAAAAIFTIAAATDPGPVAAHGIDGLVALLVLAPAIIADRGDGPVGRLLAWRPLAAVGIVSYGIYLWHGPVILELADRGLGDSPALGPVAGLGVVALATSLAVAALSYRIVERPLLRRKHRGGRRSPSASSTPARPFRA